MMPANQRRLRPPTREAAVNDYQILADDVSGPFDPERFAIARRPVTVAQMTPGSLSKDLPSCLDMLVMLPNGRIILPEPYASDKGVNDFIAACVAFEDRLLPGWHKTRYAYLTVDCREVKAGKTHRNAGWHFDGMQGARYPVKVDACHQYIVSDRMPTEFTDTVTDASQLDDDRHNWFVELGRQVPDDAEILRPKPFEIAAMSAYQLHRSPVAGPDDGGWRAFLRLDFSVKLQDRLGNTINPDLPAPFPYVERPMPAHLALPVSDAGWEKGMVFAGPC